MKILIPKFFWVGGLMDNIETAFRKNGHVVVSIAFSVREKSKIKNPLNQLKKYNDYSYEKKIHEFNKRFKKLSKEFRPDLVFVLNSGKLTPDTVEYLRNQIKCYLVCFLPDNPFDSSRSKYTAMNLQWFHTIFSCEETWIQNITNIAPKSRIHNVIIGYNKDEFYPLDNSTLRKQDYNKFYCDVSFTGAGYSDLAEGSYRAMILNHISDFNLKFWSNDDWSFRFKYLSNLKKSYKGKRLSYDELKKLYTISLINLNMPSPQIFTSFQPRILEIGACKGFQIADHRLELRKYFNENELVTFKSIDDLREKINYFKLNPSERLLFTDNLYENIITNHTWDIRISEYLDLIEI